MKLDVDTIRGEAMAGHLWMRLDLPRDASRRELEQYARDLIEDIGANPSSSFVESQIRTLQVQKLCRPCNNNTVSDLAKKSIAVARSARR